MSSILSLKQRTLLTKHKMLTLKHFISSKKFPDRDSYSHIGKVRTSKNYFQQYEHLWNAICVEGESCTKQNVKET
jgi:hypothetical protein